MLGTPKDKPWFFIVRRAISGEAYALEYGDLKSTRAEMRLKGPNRTVLDHFELPLDYEPTLDEAIAAYKRGIRAKPIVRPLVSAPPTFNSVRRPKLGSKPEFTAGGEGI